MELFERIVVLFLFVIIVINIMTYLEISNQNNKPELFKNNDTPLRAIGDHLGTEFSGAATESGTAFEDAPLLILKDVGYPRPQGNLNNFKYGLTEEDKLMRYAQWNNILN